MDRWARRWHGLTAVVVVVALVLQLTLSITGAAVLVEEDPPGLWARIGQYFSYFTIQSNLLVAIGVVPLAVNAGWDGRRWRVVRLAGVVGITVTGLVHFFLLRPLLDLEGLSLLCDALLHRVSPVLVILGWAFFGPRPRITGRDVAWAIAWPIAWLGWSLAVGAITGWFPYPFLNYEEEGWGPVAIASVAITVLFLALFAGAHRLDRWRTGPPYSRPR